MARIQQTLASQASFEKHGRKSKRELFLDQIHQGFHGRSCWHWLSRIIPRRATAVSRLALQSCCEFTFCNNGSTFRTQAWKKPSMSRPCCGAGRDHHPSLPPRARRARSMRSDAGHQEQHQGPSENQGEAFFPHPEADLRIYQGALPRHMEEPPVAVCGLRAGEPLPTSQSAGPSKGVVSPEARKRPHATRKARSTPFRQKTDPQSGNHPKPRRRRKITPLRKGSLAAHPGQPHIG
jgi:hypothetical protein